MIPREFYSSRGPTAQYDGPHEERECQLMLARALKPEIPPPENKLRTAPQAPRSDNFGRRSGRHCTCCSTGSAESRDHSDIDPA